jgi:DNA-binding NtrC family response regulator
MNVLYQAAVMQRESSIGRGDVEAAIPKIPSVPTMGPFSRQRDEPFDLKRRLEAIERVFVEDALEDTLDANGKPNQTKAADLLGISQQALSKKLLKWENV